MHVLEFDHRWIHKVMILAWSVSMSVLLNGREGKLFFLTRGYRQRDPMSPYLFIIVVEMFSRSLKQAIVNQRIRLPRLVIHLPKVDALLCGRALEEFEGCSGLKVNHTKSIVVGFNNTSTENATAASILNCQQGVLPLEYVGVPCKLVS